MEIKYGFKVTASVRNGKELLEILDSVHCDIILMDIEMEVMGGVEATRKAKKIYPNIKIIAVSMYDDKFSILEMLKAGAKGFHSKSNGLAELIKAIRMVLDGKAYFTDEILKNANQKTDLSFDEQIVLNLSSDGFTSEEIAKKTTLGISWIDKTKNKMKIMLKAKNIANLIKIAMRKKMIK